MYNIEKIGEFKVKFQDFTILFYTHFYFLADHKWMYSECKISNGFIQ